MAALVARPHPRVLLQHSAIPLPSLRLPLPLPLLSGSRNSSPSLLAMKHHQHQERQKRCTPWLQQVRVLDRRGKSSLSVVASLPQDQLWADVKVADKKQVAEQLFAITLDIQSSTELKSGYKKAGQYVQLKVGGSEKPAFLAIASPPQAAAEGWLEFLVKYVDGSTAALFCDAKEGERVSVSPVMGKGFQVDLLNPPENFPTVLLFATGSGISPVRALLESGALQATARADVRLFYGARNLKRMAYQERFDSWEGSGVRVVPVLSQPEGAWDGHQGFVQAAFMESGGLADGTSAGAILCGQRAMAEEVMELLTSAGVAKDKILMNF
eukprot:TRINITY_DN228_c0_g1_i4.p1 TRINITY_DN228_c0_g1~~TRINITY_DN228_c0_g1_i4.p1  ORF type:complete len:341 (+),score=65.63 TRINITY_DN228_c0_g1_i4:46-1023(+)